MHVAYFSETHVGTRLALDLAPLSQIAHDLFGAERYARRALGDHRGQTAYRRIRPEQLAQ